jgi:hypothetical protein
LAEAMVLGSKTNEVLTLHKKLVLWLQGWGMRFDVSMSLALT